MDANKMVTVDVGPLNAKAREKLRRAWYEAHMGLGNSTFVPPPVACIQTETPAVFKYGPLLRWLLKSRKRGSDD